MLQNLAVGRGGGGGKGFANKFFNTLSMFRFIFHIQYTNANPMLATKGQEGEDIKQNLPHIPFLGNF